MTTLWKSFMARVFLDCHNLLVVLRLPENPPQGTFVITIGVIIHHKKMESSVTYVFMCDTPDETQRVKITHMVPEFILKNLAQISHLRTIPNSLRTSKQQSEMVEACEKIEAWFYDSKMMNMKTLEFTDCVSGPVVFYNLAMMY